MKRMGVDLVGRLAGNKAIERKTDYGKSQST
jgi:hypothetical protein